jgi:oligopeptide/dipeptide ABC transporter ATP-binding protein
MPSTAGRPDTGARPLVQVENLSIRLAVPGGELTLVDDVSFSIDRGETLCLVGESGCGKSLTARAVLRLIDPPVRIASPARVSIADRDLMAATDEEMRRIRGRVVAMIFQEPMSSLNPVYTVGDQVSEAIVWHRKVSAAEARARTVDLFRLVGIPSPERRVDQYPHELSGGMQQRVMIAMALSCDPSVLVADEPTTALDVTIQAQILDLLREMQSRLDMALLLITHDLSVVSDMATDVAVMYAGSIVESGPVKQVLGTPQHPYTEALLQSIPRLGADRTRRLNVIRGIVPSPAEWPAGCRFAPRCDHAFAPCVSERPLPLDAGASQHAACWLLREGRRRTGGMWGAPPP